MREESTVRIFNSISGAGVAYNGANGKIIQCIGNENASIRGLHNDSEAHAREQDNISNEDEHNQYYSNYCVDEPFKLTHQ